MRFTDLKEYITEAQAKAEPSKDELRTLKTIEEEILQNSAECRNSDKKLIQAVVWEITGHEIPLDVLMAIPSFESMTRVRRKFNEEGLFLPTSKIAEGRFETERQTSEWALE